MRLHAELIDQKDLTPREAEIFALVCEGLPDKAIAQALAISIRTVECHIDHVYGKIGVQQRQLSARAAAIATAVAQGMVRLSMSALCLWLCVGAVVSDDQAVRAPRVRPSVTRERRWD